MKTLIKNALILTVFVPGLAFAAGSDDDSEPATTETTTTCENGMVWDKDSKSCVAPKDARLDDDTRYNAVRELAYAGQLENASIVLATMADQDSDRVLTYKGFIARKEGRWSQAMGYYGKALAQNPDNILARSYMAQGLAQAGALDAAKLQLQEIRDRGGEGSWAEAALVKTIETGVSSDY